MTNETPRPLLFQQVSQAMPDVARQKNAVAGIRRIALPCFAVLIPVSIILYRSKELWSSTCKRSRAVAGRYRVLRDRLVA
jgi:hypothetical protein